MKKKPLSPIGPIFKGTKNIYGEHTDVIFKIRKITITGPCTNGQKNGESIDIAYAR
jgi:hypothetical protein